MPVEARWPEHGDPEDRAFFVFGDGAHLPFVLDPLRRMVGDDAVLQTKDAGVVLGHPEAAVARFVEAQRGLTAHTLRQAERFDAAVVQTADRTRGEAEPDAAVRR